KTLTTAKRVALDSTEVGSWACVMTVIRYASAAKRRIQLCPIELTQLQPYLEREYTARSANRRGIMKDHIRRRNIGITWLQPDRNDRICWIALQEVPSNLRVGVPIVATGPNCSTKPIAASVQEQKISVMWADIHADSRSGLPTITIHYSVPAV